MPLLRPVPESIAQLRLAGRVFGHALDGELRGPWPCRRCPARCSVPARRLRSWRATVQEPWMRVPLRRYIRPHALGAVELVRVMRQHVEP